MSIHLTDKEIVNYVYELNGYNLSESKILDIRQTISEDAKKWSNEEQQNHTVNEYLENFSEERMAVGLDEGKAFIRSEKKNEDTKKYDRAFRNVKLAVAYPIDEKGKKCGQSLYAGEIHKPLEDFGDDFKKLLIESNFNSAVTKAVLSDGANGYADFLKEHCPDAIHILDSIHLKEHIWIIAKTLHPDIQGKPAQDAMNFVNEHYERLKENGFKSFIRILSFIKQNLKDNAAIHKIWDNELNYFNKNEYRLDYPRYIELNLPLGSGVIEGSIKHICNKRLKKGSPCWLLKSVSGLLELRIIWFTDSFNNFWEWRNYNLSKKNYEFIA